MFFDIFLFHIDLSSWVPSFRAAKRRSNLASPICGLTVTGPWLLFLSRGRMPWLGGVSFILINLLPNKLSQNYYYGGTER
jgi:hypothetical protein